MSSRGGRVPRAHNNGQRRAAGDRPQGKGKPGGRGKKGAPRGDKAARGGKPQHQNARPSRAEKPIDPDNPFAAALMGLKDNK